MAVEPQQHLDAFEAYSRLRRRRASQEYLRRLDENRVSYESNMAHIKRQLRGECALTRSTEALGKSSELLRQRHLDCLAEMAAVKASLVLFPSLGDAQLWDEFSRMCAIPQVIAVERKREEEFFFTIRAEFTLDCFTYDLGDWTVAIAQFELQEEKEIAWNVPELRSGLKVDTRVAPAYRINSSFCFGENAGPINSYFRVGRYLQGLELITYALCSINEEDVHAVPFTFHQAIRKEQLWPSFQNGQVIFMS